MTYRFFYQKLFKIVQKYVSQIKTKCPDTSMIKGIHLVRGVKREAVSGYSFQTVLTFSFVANDEDGAFVQVVSLGISDLLCFGAIAVDWNYFSRPSSRRVKFLKNTLLLIDSCTDPSAPSS